MTTGSEFFGPFDAVDSAGNVYAEEFNNGGNPQYILVYAAGANGSNVAPVRTIGYVAPGGSSGIFKPQGLAVDNSRHELYVYDYNLAGIEVFTLGPSGNSTPIRTISGSNTTIAPNYSINSGIAFNSVTGDLYVESQNGILVFPQGASGNVAPSRSITTSGVAEYGLGIGPITQDIYESAGYNAINVYSPTASGNASRVRLIYGSNTDIGSVGGLALDNAENVYLANSSSSVSFAPCTFGGFSYGDILIWGPAATGNVAPNRYLCGPNTGFYDPEAVAIGP